METLFTQITSYYQLNQIDPIKNRKQSIRKIKKIDGGQYMRKYNSDALLYDYNDEYDKCNQEQRYDLNHHFTKRPNYKDN